MAFNPSLRRIILWSLLSLLCIAAIAVVTVPPHITLNNMKPRLQAAIAENTGISATLAGDVTFSLLGHVTIVANDIFIPNGHIDSIMFRVPLRYLFDLNNAPLPSDITVYGANMEISSLAPAPLANAVRINNSTISFLGKDYMIISGRLYSGRFNGQVRTDQHKYEIDFSGDRFYVANRTNHLAIVGRLTDTGGAIGTMSFDTNNINRLFEFDAPRIQRPVSATMNFEWDGRYGFKFTDIHGDNFSGNIILYPSGKRDIQLTSHDMNFDFSFLLQPNKVLENTRFDLDLAGDLMFAGHRFYRLAIRARGTKSALDIEKIIADDITMTGGTITAGGASRVMIQMPYQAQPATCLFSGTPSAWRCATFIYGDMSGELAVTDNTFDISVRANTPMPDFDEIKKLLRGLGRRGTVTFLFSDAAGTLHVSSGDIRPEYKFVRHRTLSWLGLNIYFLPAFMRNAVGDFFWDGDTVIFHPATGDWELSVSGRNFSLTGRDAKAWFPSLDLRALNNFEYLVTGTFTRDAISDLKISIANHEFRGSASGRAITLHTDTLNLDTFASQDFMDNIDEMEFLADAPIMIPFGINANISLSADSIIYNGEEYKNFVYALKPDTQIYSITDDARGNMLATIEKQKSAYNIFVQLNNFVTHGRLLRDTMPLNISDTRITAEMDMHTFGRIAHDLKHNLTGTMDITMTGGTLTGIGTDAFYAAAQNINTTTKAEYALAGALDGGQTQIKKMHIVGSYNQGDFKTTAPLTLSMRHTDVTGALEISDGEMFVTLNLIMRGTSPAPTPIALEVMPDGTRRYALSEIMTNFDASFLRQFVLTHNRF